MDISYLIDCIDAELDPFMLRGYSEPHGDKYSGEHQFANVQRDICSHYAKKYIPLDRPDERFQLGLVKIQGCAAYSLKALCSKPSQGFMSRWLGGLVIFALPVAHLLDLGINSTMWMVHTALCLDSLVLCVWKQGASLLIPKKYKQDLPKSSFDFSHTRWLGKGYLTLKSLGLIFQDTLYLPFYYLGIAKHDLKLSYWVYDTTRAKFHLILDQEKVQWLQKKYCYPEGVDLIHNMFKPTNPYFEDLPIPYPEKLKLSYSSSSITTPSALKIEATWISWSYAYRVGDTRYYNPLKNYATS